jgi:hypothetical protein
MFLMDGSQNSLQIQGFIILIYLKRHSASYVVDEIKKGADIKTAMLQNYKFPISDEIEKKIRELVDTNQDWAARLNSFFFKVKGEWFQNH